MDSPMMATTCDRVDLPKAWPTVASTLIADYGARASRANRRAGASPARRGPPSYGATLVL